MSSKAHSGEPLTLIAGQTQFFAKSPQSSVVRPVTNVPPEVRGRLDSTDWRSLYQRLYNYARRKTNALRFVHTSGELPLGLTHNDLVQEAITKVYRGDRKWDPGKDPNLFIYLTNVFDSLLSGLRNKAGYRYRDPQDISELAGLHEAGYNDCFEVLKRIVKAASADDEDLDNVRQGLEDGMSPSEIAKFFSISVQSVYTLVRKLRRRIDKKMAAHPCNDQWQLSHS